MRVTAQCRMATEKIRPDLPGWYRPETYTAEEIAAVRKRAAIDDAPVKVTEVLNTPAKIAAWERDRMSRPVDTKPAPIKITSTEGERE